MKQAFNEKAYTRYVVLLMKYVEPYIYIYIYENYWITLTNYILDCIINFCHYPIMLYMVGNAGVV